VSDTANEGALAGPFVQLNEADALESALVFASLGARVLPLIPGTKRPYLKWSNATEDDDRVFELWRKYPDADVGILTGQESGLVVVDGDGPEGVKNARELLGDIDTLRVKTKRGVHWYFAHPRDGWVPTSAGRVATGVDIRGDGGLVAAPPSGGRVVDNPDVGGLAPFPLDTYRGAAPGARVDVDLAELPSVDNEDETAVATRDRMIAGLLGVEQGRRNQVLYQAGSDLFFLAQRGGLDGRKTAVLLAEAAHEAGLDSAEIPGTIRSAASNGAGKASKPIDAKTLDVAALLDNVVAFLQRFGVYADEHQPVALALWAVHTHCFGAADATPYLIVSSPAPQSGKSRVGDVLELLVRAPLPTADASAASVYRSIQLWEPTLIMDEIDTVFRRGGDDDSADLRRILNAGFARGRYAIRVEGKDRTPTKYATFCPKLLIGIDKGTTPDTIQTRSIPVRIHRKKRTESVERFRRKLVAKEGSELHGNLAAWGKAHVEQLAKAHPELPDELDDRQQDIWEPLLAIADMAGATWGERARTAAKALHGAGGESATEGVSLLGAIKEAFDTTKATRLPTGVLLTALINQEGPWADRWENAVSRDNVKGPGAQLAGLLRPYGIRSKQIRIGEQNVRGYERHQFKAAWGRYL